MGKHKSDRPKWIIRHDKDDAGFKVVKNDSGKLGLLDPDGKLVLDYLYQSIESQGMSAYCVQKLDNGNLQVTEYYYLTNKKVTGKEFKDPDIQKHKEELFNTEAKKLIQDYYQDGCPCRYPRFVHILDRHSSEDWINYDVNLLFYYFKEFLEKKESPGQPYTKYTCPKCGTTYKSRWFTMGWDTVKQNIDVDLSKDLNQIGADVVLPVPQILYISATSTPDRPDFKYNVVEDPMELISYLREKR